MKKAKNILIVLLILINISCNKDDVLELKTNNYLIFGHYYGQCAGERCVETFKLTGTKLFEDTNDDYSLENLNFTELDNSKFEQVKDIVDEFPERLLNEDTKIFGCPDCADGGGLFIQYSNNGNIKSWRIDQVKDNIPTYLHSFIDKVNAKIQLL